MTDRGIRTGFPLHTDASRKKGWPGKKTGLMFVKNLMFVKKMNNPAPTNPILRLRF
jgi:hypothetical protein